MARAIHREPAHCIICTKDIPQDRNIKGSVTCSAECAEKRRKAQRTLQDDRECRYCSRPASRSAVTSTKVATAPLSWVEGTA